MLALRRRRHTEKGQAVVELALALPVLILIMAAIMEFGLIFSTQLTLQHAAREGGRLAATGAPYADVRARIDSATSSIDQSQSPVTVTLTPANEADRVQGGDVTVEVGYRYQMIFPVISDVIGQQLHLAGKVTMKVE